MPCWVRLLGQVWLRHNHLPPTPSPSPSTTSSVPSLTCIFAASVKDSGAIGKFLHRREPAPIDNQTVIRLNRDTLYSSAVFDLDAGPVTITLPDAGKRFMSMQVISEDHYVPEVVYGKGSYTLTKEKVGTRYVPLRSGRWSTPSIPRISSRSTHCRMRSRSTRRPRENSRLRTGIRPARRRCATRCWFLRRPCRTSGRPSVPRSRSGSDPPSDRNRRCLGRQPRQGRDLSQCHAGQK